LRALAIIPARYASIRFPGKPLALIGGKPLVQHVWERCRQADAIERVIVATEDARIFDACAAFGAEAELTSPDHVSGTDRVAEIALRHGEFDVVLNVQGDEPAISPDTVSAVARAFRESEREIVTAISPLEDASERENPNVVKAVIARSGRALYFSRAAIPFLRGDVMARFHRHQGIYGFRADILQRATTLPVSELERAESLEQLRWLENGLSIHCVVVPAIFVGVDVPSDIPIVETLLKSQEK